MQLTGAQLIVQLLARQGVRTVAGIPGGSNLPLYDALAEHGGIRHVLARHEQGAGFIAQGMARASGRPAVCLATSGPGATNILTAVADARLDSIPLVCITGQVPQSMIGTDAFQEVDTYGLSIPVTKHNFLVRSAAELLDVVPRAFGIAASGRPGPVWIDVPKDVQNATVEFPDWPAPGGAAVPPVIALDTVMRAARLINSSRRPILYLGGGVIHGGATDLVVRLAERGAVPATMTLMGLGAVPIDHPLSIGMLGMHGARYTNLALEECDLLIAVGVRFDDRATGQLSQFCPRARVIHIDVDPSELGKLKHAHVAIAGDVGEVLQALLPLVKQNSRSTWLRRVAELRACYPLRTPGINDLATPYGLIRATADLLGDDGIVTTDVGQHQMWAAQTYPVKRARQWLTSGGLGTMGFGLPAAIGAALARPERQVLCITGDGSLLMNIQELATAAELDVDVKVLLMNNRALGLVQQQQELFYGRRVYAARFDGAPDFVQIAHGFGLPAYDLGRAEDPRMALLQAFARRGPCLIHAPIAARQHVYPMVPPGAANKDMIGGEADEPVHA